ncbi:hypothetical protein P154DRAFT_428852 [Amniculicola lignicola CBS 123094]|uniref:Arrestin C-terminal-like domain-containing protein n=1 Tax=Amniculicola lignicola CBS 123094 TaxID=1392246 RepID=A0A6A5WR82_9PLEO|nr:hypothetical protein P154DRAFT_428852 [Amniculicola lignicola CBS 123094]
MTSSSARKPTPSLSTSRSLLSRLKSPLQTKTRNFADFYIQPDDPHRQYSPGDIISGTVIIKVLKPLRITHLVVSLHGYAQVFKNPNAPGDAYKNYSNTVGSGKGKKGGSYFGNGFASLFEDEVVLCGEGRLGEGVYHFNFELEFPTKGLPSSIDFERGTVSYMLTSTLTRPTTMSPITSCDTKVYVMDVIDVAPIPEPKPRVISLEPISRRARTKASTRRQKTIAEATQPQTNAEGSSERPRTGRTSELSSVAEESDNPGSPAPSDVSFESQFSSGNASGTEYGVRSVNTTTEGGSQAGAKSTFKGKTITATIDVSKGGFLRGEQIPVTIKVDHTKHVRSLKGIIVTLYRQARVDMHPALPVAPNSKGDKTKSEDYYPKSRTGLGGLSLSSAGSSHLFRKDLAQSFAPLFVDPRTLAAEVKCAVRVPDEVFPTISNVPGAMISFRYFVEVIVDIQGKLSGLDRMLANSALLTPSSYGQSSGMARSEDGAGGMFSAWGGNYVDTDAIRREKGVISCIFEVVIGTKDSEKNGKRKQKPTEATLDAQPDVHEIPLGPGGEPYTHDGSEHDYYNYDENGQYYDGYGYENGYAAPFYEDPGYRESDASQPAYQHPPPTVENEEELSEKERLRRAEARLLPSQPPLDAGPSSLLGTQQGMTASAPVIDDDGDEPNPPYFPPESSAGASPPPFTPTAPFMPSDTDSLTHATGSSLTINVHRTSPTSTPTPARLTTSTSTTDANVNDTIQQNNTKPLPPLPPPSPSPAYFPAEAVHVQPTDDKQELQRMRLQMETSAPPELEDSEEGPVMAGGGAGIVSGRASASVGGSTAEQREAVAPLTLAPSAPVLDDDENDVVLGLERGEGSRGGESLPVYRR